MRAITFGLILCVTPVQAARAQTQSPASATLASPTETERLIVNDTLWRCAGTTCTGPGGGGRVGDHQACRDLARKAGAVAAYTSVRGTLSADDLTRCNGRAKRSDRR